MEKAVSNFHLPDGTVRRWILLKTQNYRCNHCNKTFANKRELSKHVRNRHDISSSKKDYLLRKVINESFPDFLASSEEKIVFVSQKSEEASVQTKKLNLTEPIGAMKTFFPEKTNIVEDELKLLKQELVTGSTEVSKEK